MARKRFTINVQLHKCVERCRPLGSAVENGLLLRKNEHDYIILNGPGKVGSQSACESKKTKSVNSRKKLLVSLVPFAWFPILPVAIWTYKLCMGTIYIVIYSKLLSAYHTHTNTLRWVIDLGLWLKAWHCRKWRQNSGHARWHRSFVGQNGAVMSSLLVSAFNCW